jgi:hypothetical protein
MLHLRSKIDVMLKERCLKLNELFFLAMYRTSVELKFDKQR